MKKEIIRNSNLELLRILAMFLIISHHYILHGALPLEEMPYTIHKVIALCLSAGGRSGVSLFLLISGYFSIRSTFNVKRVITLIVKVWVFSVLLFLVFHLILTPDATLNIKSLVKIFLPSTFTQWWFATVFIILSLLSPFINIALRALTQNQHKNLVVLLIVIWCIIPTFTAAEFGFSRLAWAVSLYIISAYFSLYPPKIRFNVHIGLCVFWLIVLFTSIFILEYLGRFHSVFSTNSQYFCSFNKLPVFMFSLELFLIFTNMKPRYSKVINTVASTTFGIYLIHENVLTRPYIWKTLFDNTEYYGSLVFFARYAGVVVLIFVICGLIDFIVWQKVLGPLFDLILNKYLARIVNFITNTQVRVLTISKRFL